MKNSQRERENENENDCFVCGKSYKFTKNEIRFGDTCAKYCHDVKRYMLLYKIFVKNIRKQNESGVAFIQ